LLVKPFISVLVDPGREIGKRDSDVLPLAYRWELSLPDQLIEILDCEAEPLGSLFHCEKPSNVGQIIVCVAGIRLLQHVGRQSTQNGGNMRQKSRDLFWCQFSDLIQIPYDRGEKVIYIFHVLRSIHPPIRSIPTHGLPRDREVRS